MKSSRIGGHKRDPKGKNWMTAMGILFIVMATIIALRNLYLITTEFSFGFYLDNYIGGGVLIFWGYYKKNHDDEKDSLDEDGWRSFNYDQRK
jgi:hypothetical protein